MPDFDTDKPATFGMGPSHFLMGQVLELIQDNDEHFKDSANTSMEAELQSKRANLAIALASGLVAAAQGTRVPDQFALFSVQLRIQGIVEAFQAAKHIDVKSADGQTTDGAATATAQRQARKKAANDLLTGLDGFAKLFK